MAENDPPIHLIPWERSRKRLKDGTIVCFRLPDNEYVFGRVIERENPKNFAPLYYIYSVVTNSDDPGPIRDLLTPDNLLLPPLFSVPLQSSGLAKIVAHWELHDNDLLPTQCFLRSVGFGQDNPYRVRYDPASGSHHMQDRSLEAGNLYDAQGNPLTRRSEPVGRTPNVIFAGSVADMIWETLHAAPPEKIIRVSTPT